MEKSSYYRPGRFIPTGQLSYEKVLSQEEEENNHQFYTAVKPVAYNIDKPDMTELDMNAMEYLRLSE